MEKQWRARYVVGRKDDLLWPVMTFTVPWSWTDEEAAEYLKNQGYAIIKT